MGNTSGIFFMNKKALVSILGFHALPRDTKHKIRSGHVGTVNNKITITAAMSMVKPGDINSG